MENKRTFLQYYNKPRNDNQKRQHEKRRVILILVDIIQQCIRDSGGSNVSSVPH